MKLFEVTNGWGGESYTRITVIADTEEKAIAIAKEKYEKEAREDVNKQKNARREEIGMKLLEYKQRYSESYYNNLKAECLCEDTTKEWACEPRDY